MELTIVSKKYGSIKVLYDDEDHDLISTRTWTLAKRKNTFYVMCTVKRVQTFMHHFLLGKKLIDHINRCGFDNRRCNLREATYAQNAVNRPGQPNTRTGFMGVLVSGTGKCYNVFIGVNKRSVFGGGFTNIYAAALRYNELAIKHYGDFAWLNPLTTEQITEATSMDYRAFKKAASGYYGVKKCRGGRWAAEVKIKRKTTWIGSYDTAEDAAIARDRKVIELGQSQKYMNNLEAATAND